jgi:peptidoglycan/LPS O-acetylase OafA/YrhL
LKTNYPTINLLRGIAAAMVCIFHFIGYTDFRGDLFSNDSLLANIGKLGTNGVFVFFVISGFVIPLSLSKDQFNLKQLPQFLSRRFIRIEIPYLVSILLILLVNFLFAIKNNSNFNIDVKQFVFHILYIIPFSKYDWYNIIYWTLAIEFQFYIAIGLLYFLLSSKNKIVVLLALLIFGLSSLLFNDNRFIFEYSTIFAQGIVLFLLKTERIKQKLAFVLLGLFVIATAYHHSITISAFSLLTVLAIHFIEINKKLSNQFGDISYSLYLTHGLIGGNLLYLFSRYFTSFSGKILLVIAALSLSLLFSYIYWRFIENPSRKLSKKISIS